MFSPNELLHFVFADGNDLYCCNEVLALDLNQYLWLLLHEQGYGCVYYLDLSRDEASVRTYGDRMAQGYTPEKPRWGLNKQRIINSSLHKWILKQLTEKDPRRSAIVCELHEFCSYFNGPDWNDFFKDLASLSKRTGILVLTSPPEAEASRSLFLKSPVFDSLRDTTITGIRSASLCDMYAAMHRYKPERMVFLNAYTAERIRSMLTRILLEDSKRTMDCDLLPEMEYYLLQWMNNPELRKKDAQLEKLLPSPEDSFRNTYDRLRKEECWAQLTAKASQLVKAGGIQKYAEDLGCELVEDPTDAVCVRRNPDSYAGRCLNLRLRSAVAESEEREKIQDLLVEIRRQVLAPMNREENPKITGLIDSLLPELSSADQSGDAGTVRRILYSINFCIQKICVQPKSKEETSILKLLDMLQNYIGVSRTYFYQKQSNSINRMNTSAGKNKLTALAMKQSEDKEEQSRRILSNYEDAVQASIVEISMATAASVSELVDDLSDQLNRQNDIVLSEQIQKQDNALNKGEKQQTESQSEPVPPPKQEPRRPNVEEEEFILTDDDFNVQF